MGGDRQPPAGAAASVASVLGDDDLLSEILLRLGFANFLIRAALISKRWLLHVLDPRFLRRFRERNPPHLFGFCVVFRGNKFVPLPHPPELASLSNRVASSCGDALACPRYQEIKYSQNGRLIIDSFDGHKLQNYQLSPLLADESIVVIPPIPPPHHKFWRRNANFTEFFPPEDGGCDGITLVRLWKVRRNVYAEVNFLRSNGWGKPATAIEIELPHDITILTEMLPPIHGKVFMVTIHRLILGLDLATAHLFLLELPNGVERNYMLSRADDTGFYLVNAEGFQLSVWLHRMTGNGDGADGWLLVDTFCVHEACTRIVGDGWLYRGHIVDVVAVGDNAHFVLLDHASTGVILYVHLKSRVVEKVYEKRADTTRSGRISIPTIMTPWPPIFPSLNIGHDQEE